MSYEPRFPDFLGCLTRWKLGFEMRSPTGERIRIPWSILKIKHFDLQRDLFSYEVGPEHDHQEVCKEVEQRILARLGPLSTGAPQQIWIDCEFFDGVHSPQIESWNGAITLPPNAPAWGNTSYAGMGRDLSDPRNQGAIYTRHTIDMHGAAMNALTLAEGKNKRLDDHFERIISNQQTTIQGYQDREVSVVKLWRELQESKVKLEAEEAFEKWKLVALQSSLEKLQTLAGPAVLSLSRFARDYWRKKHGKSMPHPSAFAMRTQEVMRGLIRAIGESKVAKTPQELEMMLKGLGADDKIVDEVLDLTEEFAMQEMEAKARAENLEAMRALSGFDELTKLLPESWKKDTTIVDEPKGEKKSA
jgi:hypothetical protein